MATHCGILAWEIPWTEEPRRLQFMRVAKESDMSSETKQQEGHFKYRDCRFL